MKHINEVIKEHTKKLEATIKQLSTKLKKANLNLKNCKQLSLYWKGQYQNMRDMKDIAISDCVENELAVEKKNNIVKWMLVITLVLSILFTLSTL